MQIQSLPLSMCSSVDCCCPETTTDYVYIFECYTCALSPALSATIVLILLLLVLKCQPLLETHLSYLFIYGCVGSYLQCTSFLLRHAGFLSLWHAGSRDPGFSGCGAPAYLPCSMWDFSRPGVEVASPALEGRILTLYHQGNSPSVS